MLAIENRKYTAINSSNRSEEAATANIKKILLAEDDDDDFNVFNSAILSISSSVEILRTKNGIMFSSLLETSIKPDVIFLDINMSRPELGCL